MSKSKESTTTVLVATQLIRGGTKGKDDSVDRAELRAGEELTDARRKALGLSADDVKGLIERGAITERQARLAAGVDAVDPADLAAETARANKAEADLAAANERISTLETQLEAAKKAPAAGAGTKPAE